MANAKKATKNDDSLSGVGMVGGAAAGAAAGSMVGPVGAAVGAVVGGVAGANARMRGSSGGEACLGKAERRQDSRDHAQECRRAKVGAFIRGVIWMRRVACFGPEP